jgi:hypothetical protein
MSHQQSGEPSGEQNPVTPEASMLAGGHAPHVHGPGCNHGHGHHHHDLTPYVRATPKVGANDPCPCGSGKKHKKCCRP